MSPVRARKGLCSPKNDQQCEERQCVAPDRPMPPRLWQHNNTLLCTKVERLHPCHALMVNVREHAAHKEVTSTNKRATNPLASEVIS
eukprot:m.434020 g.434020  ORF g.434020 m.434020 type:complete len:87 (+) comp17654_c0_seq1:4532-4792(+)